MLHPKREEAYIVNLYQMVANNGRYYLIANYDKYNNISHYRIDRMTNVQMINEKIKPINTIDGCKKGFSLPSHMAEHIYMFSGEAIRAKLEVESFLMSELVDWFGKDFTVIMRDDEKMIIKVKCNEKALKYWVLQYGSYVELLEPLEMRNEIKELIYSMNEKYQKGR